MICGENVGICTIYTYVIKHVYNNDNNKGIVSCYMSPAGTHITDPWV